MLFICFELLIALSNVCSLIFILTLSLLRYNTKFHSPFPPSDTSLLPTSCYKDTLSIPSHNYNKLYWNSSRYWGITDALYGPKQTFLFFYVLFSLLRAPRKCGSYIILLFMYIFLYLFIIE